MTTISDMEMELAAHYVNNPADIGRYPISPEFFLMKDTRMAVEMVSEHKDVSTSILAHKGATPQFLQVVKSRRSIAVDAYVKQIIEANGKAMMIPHLESALHFAKNGKSLQDIWNQVSNIENVVNKGDSRFKSQTIRQRNVAYRKLMKDLASGKAHRMPVLIPGIEHFLKIVLPGHFIFILASPGGGKTMAADMAAYGYAERGYNVLLIDTELEPEFKDLRRIAAATGIPVASQLFPELLSDEQNKRIELAMKKQEDMPGEVLFQSAIGWDMESVCRVIRSVSSTYTWPNSKDNKLHVVMVDYLSILRRSSSGTNDLIDELLMLKHTTSKQAKCLCFAFGQPTKSSQQGEEDGRLLTLNDYLGTGGAKYVANLGLTLNKKYVDGRRIKNQGVISVDKNTFGPEGTIDLKFNHGNFTYEAVGATVEGERKEMEEKVPF